MPENAALFVDEHYYNLVLTGYLEAVAEAVFVDVERNDPGPGFGVSFVAAHGRVLPPAKDHIFGPGDGHAVPAEVEVGVLESLRERHPGVDFSPLLGLEGNQQQIELRGKVTGKREPGFAEIVGDDGREGGRL